jgi:hypothetical protein
MATYILTPCVVLDPESSSDSTPLKYDNKKAAELSKPFLFSYSSFNLFESKVSVRIPDASWSKGISIESAGMEGFLEIPGKKNGTGSAMLYELGVSIKLGKDKVWHSYGCLHFVTVFSSIEQKWLRLLHGFCL